MKNDSLVQYRYVYAEHRTRRNVHHFEYGERTIAQVEQLARFQDRIPEGDCSWIKEYLRWQYQTPKLDGQTNTDYLIERCERGYGAIETKRSWKPRVTQQKARV